jgi:hypothetical protein
MLEQFLFMTKNVTGTTDEVVEFPHYQRPALMIKNYAERGIFDFPDRVVQVNSFAIATGQWDKVSM